jgi:hypothetical protein
MERLEFASQSAQKTLSNFDHIADFFKQSSFQLLTNLSANFKHNSMRIFFSKLRDFLKTPEIGAQFFCAPLRTTEVV